MKIKILLITALFSTSIFGNNLSSYYGEEQGLTGYELKSTLKKIITRGYKTRSYSQLISIYQESDIDNSYEKDGTILDIYSEDPKSEDPYSYKRGNECGSYNDEGQCYNREHLFPQGSFKRALPMRSDFHHIFPTDGYVNNKRGSLPFGEVISPKWVSKNNSKVGPNVFGNYRGLVFEPIDEFKGDIARALLYFATRYEDKHSSFNHNWMSGSKNQFYKTWFIKLLLKWHKQDPVSEREKHRNNIGHKYQGNRNPFIDHPEYVELIWQNVVS